ncbi:hypothetical protein DPMN_091448 [Dreissena polymorpha]|uniref:Uncharacterized protein n=1 Tax=Dreissena polymorpha TaxID=45954 RepID=A0A9D4QZ91_DREPO|nr:hypothetical protein DPMN_091448 [Dreissena polymorpha]
MDYSGSLSSLYGLQRVITLSVWTTAGDFPVRMDYRGSLSSLNGLHTCIVIAMPVDYRG